MRFEMSIHRIMFGIIAALIVGCSNYLAGGGSSSETVTASNTHVAAIKFSHDTIEVTSDPNLSVIIHNSSYLAFENGGFSARGTTDSSGRFVAINPDTEFCTVLIEDSIFVNAVSVSQIVKTGTVRDTLRKTGVISGTISADTSNPGGRFFVAIPGTDIFSISDNVGSVVLSRVPSGSRDVVIQPISFVVVDSSSTDSSAIDTNSITMTPNYVTNITVTVLPGEVSTFSK